jgi:hypothetical protein
MDLSRRELLRYSSLLGAGVVAGCAGDEQVNTADPDDGSGQQQNTPRQQDTPTPPTETETENSRQAVAQLGETLVYTQGQREELAFAITSARLQDALISASSGSLLSRVPERSDRSYLIADVRLENRGDEPVFPPSSVNFVANGQQYERSYVTGRDSYSRANEVLPGSNISGQISFVVPPSDLEGRIVVNFSDFGEAVTGEWVVDLGEIERIEYDYTGNSEGEFIEFGTESTRYQAAVVDVTETRQYSYSSNGYEFEEEASQGNKFVLIEVFARNTGDTPVRIPGRFDMSLIAGSSQVDAGYYSGSGAYSGGEISPGIERSGVVQFEVPESASEYQLRVNLTRDIAASWEL